MYTLTFFPVSSSTSLPRYSIITEPIYQSKSQKIRNGDDAASRSTNRSQQKVNFWKILSNKTRRKCLPQFYESLYDDDDIRSQDIVLYTSFDRATDYRDRTVLVSRTSICVVVQSVIHTLYIFLRNRRRTSSCERTKFIQYLINSLEFAYFGKK